MKHAELPTSVVERRAIVYVRQSTLVQVEENLRSSRIRVMPRRATARTRDRGPASGCRGCGSLELAG